MLQSLHLVVAAYLVLVQQLVLAGLVQLLVEGQAGVFLWPKCPLPARQHCPGCPRLSHLPQPAKDETPEGQPLPPSALHCAGELGNPTHMLACHSSPFGLNTHPLQKTGCFRVAQIIGNGWPIEVASCIEANGLNSFDSHVWGDFDDSCTGWKFRVDLPTTGCLCPLQGPKERLSKLGSMQICGCTCC